MDFTSTSNLAQTENGDPTFLSTYDKCLDFFTKITRGADYKTYLKSFIDAWNQDKQMSYQILLNLRDVRSGKGEKEIPLVILFYIKHLLSKTDPTFASSDTYKEILSQYVGYGYWKDLLRLIELETRFGILNKSTKLALTTSVELTLMATQLQTDLTTLNNAHVVPDKKAIISLCAKWAPTEKTHYNHHPLYIANSLATLMGLSSKQYRLAIGKMRAHLNVVERLMATKQFDLIDFSKLPSIAMIKLKKAFNRDTNADGIESEPRKKLHASYLEYLSKLTRGETKVNTKGVQPHELVNTYLTSSTTTLDDLVEAQWKTLKQNITDLGTFSNTTAIVDVSGSMEGTPMQVSIALGILVSQCTTGPFADKVITFDSTPRWFDIEGDNLLHKVRSLKSAPWGGSTNLRATFDLILQVAHKYQLDPANMIKTLFIFTDMQFDAVDGHAYLPSWEQQPVTSESSLAYGKRRFQEAGYEFPRIVCWNLRTSSSGTIPETKDAEGVAMLSGFSSELLKCVLTATQFTPLLILKHVLEPYLVPESIKLLTPLTLMESEMENMGKAIEQSRIKKSWKGKETETKEATIVTTTTTTDAKWSDDSESEGDGW